MECNETLKWKEYDKQKKINERRKASFSIKQHTSGEYGAIKCNMIHLKHDALSKVK